MLFNLRCQICGKFLTSENANLLLCLPSSAIIDNNGRVVPKHERWVHLLYVGFYQKCHYILSAQVKLDKCTKPVYFKNLSMLSIKIDSFSCGISDICMTTALRNFLCWNLYSIILSVIQCPGLLMVKILKIPRINLNISWWCSRSKKRRGSSCFLFFSCLQLTLTLTSAALKKFHSNFLQ